MNAEDEKELRAILKGRSRKEEKPAERIVYRERPILVSSKPRPSSASRKSWAGPVILGVSLLILFLLFGLPFLLQMIPR